MAKVGITDEALKQLANVPLGISARVNKGIESLKNWPAISGAKPLRGEWKGYYRIRRGDWRIIFRVQGDMLTIVRISDRRDAYGD